MPVLQRVRSPRRAELRARPRNVEGEGGRPLLRVRGRVRQRSQKPPAVRLWAEVRRVADRGGGPGPGRAGERAGPSRCKDAGRRISYRGGGGTGSSPQILLPSTCSLPMHCPAPTTRRSGPATSRLGRTRPGTSHARYGSELNVVRREERLLLELNGSVRDFQRDMAKETGKEILKKTAMASLLTAIAIPSALLSFSNIVSGILTRATQKETKKILRIVSFLMPAADR